MKRLLLWIMTVACIAMMSVPASAVCRTSGRFSIASSGPWRMGMTVTSGKPCSSSYQLNFPGTHLYIASNPDHGRLSLREGGHYTYVPTAGYRGADTFTLKLCGRIQGGQTESCTDLKYVVAVE